MRDPHGFQDLIFDVDGTLANTAQVAVPALVLAAAEFGLPARTSEAVIRAIGIPGLAYYQAIYPGCPDIVLREFAPAVEARERELMLELGEGLLFAGVKELLKTLTEQRYRLYIASTGTDEHIGTILAATGIGPMFAALKYGHPDKTAMVRELIGSSGRRRWVMVGDKAFDREAAAANGIAAVGAGYGYGSPAEQGGFTHRIAGPLELLDWLAAAPGRQVAK